MSLKMKYLTIILSLSLPYFINAQPHEPSKVYEDRGIELLTKASSKINSYNSLIIEFTYELENSSRDLDESASGKIYMKDNSYNMSFGDYEYISDGNTVWICLKDVGEVHISYAEDIDQSMNPIYLLKDFQEHYSAKLIRQEFYDGKNVHLVDAIPDKPQAFFKYRVAITEDDNMVAYIIAYDRHGGNYKISFDEVEKNPEISEDKFNFDESQYSGFDIIDLR